MGSTMTMDIGKRTEFRLLQEEFNMVRERLLSQIVSCDLLIPDPDLNLCNTAGEVCDGCEEAFLLTPASDQTSPPYLDQDEMPLATSDLQRKVLYETRKSHDNQNLVTVLTDGPEERNPARPERQNSRRRHKKSRQGCFNCKRRKVKCQETQPACENCSKRRLQCTYPAPKTLSTLRKSAEYAPNPIASISLQATPTIFTAIDMRLFHHFLVVAHPHLPVGNESIWTSQVPLIAHHNQYLMHAILGMAASHLELISGAEVRGSALSYRHLAIKGSNSAIIMPRRTGSQGDALMASCYLLAFQSSYMIDGMQEFLRTVRGCNHLNIQLKHENIPMAFFLTGKDHFEIMQERLLDLPTIDPELLNGAKKSLAACSTLVYSWISRQFHHILLEIVEALSKSSLRSYFKFVLTYQFISKMKNEDFDAFIDQSNTVSQILIYHFFAIELIMAPILDREAGLKGCTVPIRYHLNWIIRGMEVVPSEMTYFMKWPEAVAHGVQTELALQTGHSRSKFHEH